MSSPPADWAWLTGTTSRSVAGTSTTASGNGSGTSPHSSGASGASVPGASTAANERCFHTAGWSRNSATSAWCERARPSSGTNTPRISPVLPRTSEKYAAGGPDGSDRSAYCIRSIRHPSTSSSIRSPREASWNPASSSPTGGS